MIMETADTTNSSSNTNSENIKVLNIRLLYGF